MWRRGQQRTSSYIASDGDANADGRADRNHTDALTLEFAPECDVLGIRLVGRITGCPGNQL